MDLEEKLIISGYKEVFEQDINQGVNPNLHTYARYYDTEFENSGYTIQVRDLICYDTMFKECWKFLELRQLNGSYGGAENQPFTDFERKSIFKGYTVR